MIASHDVLVAHNPRSNAANGVGIADLRRLRDTGITIGVGGDGFTQNIGGELDLIPLLQRQQHRDPMAFPPPEVVSLGIDGNAAIVERLGDWPTGRIAPEYVADIVALDYDPVVPLLPDNALWHYARGFPQAVVRDVWVGGHEILRDGEFMTIDAELVRREVASCVERIWAS
jgi:5-methylthioadenosine/S-adenosylhomocysteine deaminase